MFERAALRGGRDSHGYDRDLDTLVGIGGQSDVDSSSGLIHDITMTVPGLTFLDAIINPFKPVNNNDLVVTVVTNTGPSTPFTYGSTQGDNFLTITTTGGEVIDSVTIDSGEAFRTSSNRESLASTV